MAQRSAPAHRQKGAKAGKKLRATATPSSKGNKMKIEDDHDTEQNDLSLDWPQKRTIMIINAPPSCPSFATLPADVVRIIFSYFALHPLIHALGLVCKRWRSCVLSGITKISLRHGTPPVSLFPSLTEIAINTGDVCRCHTLTQLTSLRIITMTIPECLCVHHIVRRNISNLTSLSLQFPVLSRHSFDSVLTDTTAPALRHLSLTLHSVTQTKVALNFISRHSYQLLSLRLHSPHLADNSVVPLLLSLQLPYLRHIGLSRFTRFDLSQAPLVESIGFQLDCRVHPELVPVGRARFVYGHLGEAPYVPPAKITYLVLAPLENEDAAYRTVAQMERLEHVVLRIPPLPVVQPPDSMLKGLRHLHTLEVIGHDAISLSALNALKSLTHLSLTLQPDTLSLNQLRLPNLKHFVLYLQSTPWDRNHQPRLNIAAALVLLTSLTKSNSLRSVQLPLTWVTSKKKTNALVSCLATAEKRGVQCVAFETAKSVAPILQKIAQQFLYLHVMTVHPLEEDEEKQKGDDDEDGYADIAHHYFALPKKTP